MFDWKNLLEYSLENLLGEFLMLVVHCMNISFQTKLMYYIFDSINNKDNYIIYMLNMGSPLHWLRGGVRMLQALGSDRARV